MKTTKEIHVGIIVSQEEITFSDEFSDLLPYSSERKWNGALIKDLHIKTYILRDVPVIKKFVVNCIWT